MFIVPAIILVVALLAAVAYLITGHIRGRRAALLDGIRKNPADYVRARLNEETPRQLELSRKAAAAGEAHREAQERLKEVARNLPSDPPRRSVIVTVTLTALWLVAFVVQYLLDFRIAKAITGNTASALLTALALCALLTAATLAGALLWENRSRIGDLLAVLGLLAATATFLTVLSLVTFLAPKRAELDFADRIDTAKQTIVMYHEDGDIAAVALAKARLQRLETERDQAADFYQAAAIVAGVLEGGAALAVPTGYLLLTYYAAQATVRRRRDEESEAAANVSRSRERFTAHISRILERAGVTQDQLGPLINAAGGQARPGNRPGAPPQVAGGPAPVQSPAASAPPPAAPRRQADGQGDGHDVLRGRNSRESGPDPSFDQA